jgi:hypothetical protein
MLLRSFRTVKEFDLEFDSAGISALTARNLLTRFALLPPSSVSGEQGAGRMLGRYGPGRIYLPFE